MEKAKFKSRKPRAAREKPEFDQKILDIARVTRVMAGGRRFSFRIAMVIGDRKGRVGVGVAKGSDVSIAVEKAVNAAKKSMITVNLDKGTIPHELDIKYKNVKLMLKPAPAGRGVIAGGAVRVICEFAGINDVVAKIISKSKNKINNARATVKALDSLKNVPASKKKVVSKDSKEKILKKEVAEKK